MHSLYVKIICIGLLLITSCSSVKSNESKVTQLEVQEDLYRFHNRFVSRLYPAFDSLKKQEIETSTRTELLSTYLLIYSESLKIVTGPYPELSVLDMLIFLRLNEISYRKQRFTSLENLFNAALKEMKKTALKFMSEQDYIRVLGVANQWDLDNPSSLAAKVRIDDFTAILRKLDKTDSLGGTGLLNQIGQGIEKVDEVLLMSNKAIYLSQQLPLVFRLQARIMSNEIFMDLTHSNLPSRDLAGVGHLINDSSSVVSNLITLASRTSQLLEVYNKTFPVNKRSSFQSKISGIDSVLDKTSHLVDKILPHLQTLPQLNVSIYSILFLFFCFVVVFCLMSVVFWTIGFHLFVKKIRPSLARIDADN
jgi:hypothetical protein